MISVEIKINGQVILAAEARRITGGPGERCSYQTGDNRIITHDYDEGAIPLAKRLLDTIGDAERMRRVLK
jgi:hypothetical protein